MAGGNAIGYLLASYLAINHFGGNYGWSALFYNSFLGGLVATGEILAHISFSANLHQVVQATYLWFIFGAFPLYVLAGLAIWMNPASTYFYVTVTALTARATSYVLYAHGDQRYTVVIFVLIPVALIIAISVTARELSQAGDHDRSGPDTLATHGIPAR